MTGIEDMNLKLIGEGVFGEKTKYSVNHIGLVRDGEWLMKLYGIKDWRDLPLLGEVESFVEENGFSGELGEFSGMGFAILTPDILNLGMWSKGNPRILLNKLWDYDFRKGLTDSARGDEFEGVNVLPYSLEELQIVAHEALAWRRYLDSKREEQDKINFFQDVFPDGELR